MFELQSKQYKRFISACGLTLAFSILTAIFVLGSGRTDSFTFINHHHHPLADFFFRYYTFLGDGVMWVPLGLVCLFWRRDWILPVVFAIVLSTAMIHILKRLVFPEELRPLSLQTRGIYVHTIDGVKTHLRNSFPSGHTGQAFTMALLLVYLLSRKWMVVAFPMAAFGVAYSRVYLAQHFVVDVLVGMLIGIISAWLAVFFSRRITQKKVERRSV